MHNGYSKYKVNVPTGTSGNWQVEHFTVTEEDAKRSSIRAIASGRGRAVPSGTYTRLMHKKAVVMSDTPDEIRDHLEAIHQAKGNVLINGLGLGMVVQAILNKETVNSVTVIELSQDVIELVAQHYTGRFNGRLEIIQADAFTWQPPKGVRYNVVWHDVWNDLCTDNLPEMHRLHRKYGKRCNWQGSWGRTFLERYRRQGY